VRSTAAITHQGDWFVARFREVEVTSQGDPIDDEPDDPEDALEPYLDDQPETASLETPVATTFQLAV